MSFYEDKIFPRALDIALAGARQTRIDLGSQASGRVRQWVLAMAPTCPAIPTRPSLKPGSQLLLFEHVQPPTPGHRDIISGRRRFKPKAWGAR